MARPPVKPMFGDLQEQVVWNMTTWHFAVRSSNKPPIHPLPHFLSLSLSLQESIWYLEFADTEQIDEQSKVSLQVNHAANLGSYIIIIIKPGTWSSKSLLTISWLGYHLQYPNDNNTYSQVKSRQNLIPKANPSQIVDWKDNNTFKLELL